MSLALTPAIHISSRAGATPCRARDLWLFFPVGDAHPHPFSALFRARAAPRLEGARPLQFSLRMSNPQLQAAAASFRFILMGKRHRTPLLCVALWVHVQHIPPNLMAAGEGEKGIPRKPLPARLSPGCAATRGNIHSHAAPSPARRQRPGPALPGSARRGGGPPARPAPLRAFPAGGLGRAWEM